VVQRHARRIAELDRLLRDRIHAGNHRLRGDHRGRRGQAHQRQQEPVGRHQVEGVPDRRRVFEQQRALAEVVEQQRRQHQAEPGQAYRPPAEVAHVGIQRLGARDDEEHAAHGEKAQRRIGRKEGQRVARPQPGQHRGMAQDLHHAERRESHEPEAGDRPEG
jgi:hypothetical protein